MGRASVADVALLSESWPLGKFPKAKFLAQAGEMKLEPADESDGEVEGYGSDASGNGDDKVCACVCLWV